MQCPKCASTIPTENINIQALVAKCDRCAEVFGFSAATVAGQRSRAAVPRPEQFRIEEGYGDNRIVWRWFQPIAFFLLFFFIAWDAFLVFWYSMAFGEMGMPWIMKVFPIVHLVVGIGGTYFTIAMFINQTTVTVSDDYLSVHHGPLPFLGSKRLDRHSVKQLYGEQKLFSGKHNRIRLSYELKALLEDGTSIRLLSALEEPQVRFLEQQLETWMGITPAPVAGELR